jgi:hypothetical protein
MIFAELNVRAEARTFKLALMYGLKPVPFKLAFRATDGEDACARHRR